MPNYDYECTHCGYSFELFQKITDKPLESCPKCSKKVKRLIGSGSGIIFKGPGFYATDYRGKRKTGTPKSTTNTCPAAKKGCDGCKQ
jgi:putative FmdB family regulatory protein